MVALLIRAPPLSVWQDFTNAFPISDSLPPGLLGHEDLSVLSGTLGSGCVLGIGHFRHCL
jgi:hypothetical protein